MVFAWCSLTFQMVFQSLQSIPQRVTKSNNKKQHKEYLANNGLYLHGPYLGLYPTQGRT
jgi:hypothetical protein